MEVKHLLVPGSYGFHLSIFLVTDDMIDIEKLWHWDEAIENFSLWMLAISREMGSIVIDALHEGVDRVTVSLDTGDNDCAILVLKCFRLLDTCCSTTYCFFVDSSCIINCKGYIFDFLLLEFKTDFSTSNKL